MKMTTAHLIANPCDDEEDNLAMLCCHSDQGEMFLMTRYPDEDELEITLDGEPSTLDGVKVTLSEADAEQWLASMLDQQAVHIEARETPEQVLHEQVHQDGSEQIEQAAALPVELPGQAQMQPGDTFVILTPGGGGFGEEGE